MVKYSNDSKYITQPTFYTCTKPSEPFPHTPAQKENKV